MAPIFDVQIRTQADAEALLQTAQDALAMPETESNWTLKDNALKAVRALLQSRQMWSDNKAIVGVVHAGCKRCCEGVLQASGSLRTSLSLSACALIHDMVDSMQSSFDPLVEPTLLQLLKVTSQTKKVVVNAGNTAALAVLQHASFSMRVVTIFANAAMGDKNAQVRSYCVRFLLAHIETAVRMRAVDAMDRAGVVDSLDKVLKKAVSDASPTVRVPARDLFLLFESVWPARAAALLGTLDNAARKLLGKPAASAAAATGTAARPARKGIDIKQLKQRQRALAATTDDTTSADVVLVAKDAATLTVETESAPTSRSSTPPPPSEASPVPDVSNDTVQTLAHVEAPTIVPVKVLDRPDSPDHGNMSDLMMAFAIDGDDNDEGNISTIVLPPPTSIAPASDDSAMQDVEGLAAYTAYFASTAPALDDAAAAAASHAPPLTLSDLMASLASGSATVATIQAGWRAIDSEPPQSTWTPETLEQFLQTTLAYANNPDAALDTREMALVLLKEALLRHASHNFATELMPVLFDGLLRLFCTQPDQLAAACVDMLDICVKDMAAEVLLDRLVRYLDSCPATANALLLLGLALRRLSPSQLRTALPRLAPSLVQAFSDRNPALRKATLDILLVIHDQVGDQLISHMSALSSMRQQLLKHYVDLRRTHHTPAHAPSSAPVTETHV
ncbi:suppressor of tub2 mutation [Sorochytrium milnesiophthora]